jgi:hypothetical protein
MRRIGVLMASAADDSENQARMAAFLWGLAQLGWTDGRNVRIDTRWATTNADDLRRHAAELAALAPDVLVAATGTATAAPWHRPRCTVFHSGDKTILILSRSARFSLLLHPFLWRLASRWTLTSQPGGRCNPTRAPGSWR